jgi:bromodomain-containing protein 7/9
MAHNDSRLAECLDYLHRLISRKDKEDIFQLPVTDDIAPGYSTIIKNPMDLSTMKKKIESQIYMNITEYRVSVSIILKAF